MIEVRLPGTIKFVPFQAWHLEAMELRDHDRVWAEKVGGAAEVGRFNQNHSLAQTAWVVGLGPICCWGFFSIAEHPNVLGGWLSTSVHLPRFRWTFHRVTQELLFHIRILQGVEDIWLWVHRDYPISQRWVERLGFGLADQSGEWWRYSYNCGVKRLVEGRIAEWHGFKFVEASSVKRRPSRRRHGLDYRAVQDLHHWNDRDNDSNPAPNGGRA